MIEAAFVVLTEILPLCSKSLRKEHTLVLPHPQRFANTRTDVANSPCSKSMSIPFKRNDLLAFSARLIKSIHA